MGTFDPYISGQGGHWGLRIRVTADRVQVEVHIDRGFLKHFIPKLEIF